MARKHTFVYALEQNARIIGDTAAVIQGKRQLSFKTLDQRCNQLAHALLKLGISRGNRLALCLCNQPEFIESTYAAWKCACVSVPLNYRFMEQELIYVINNSDSVGVILDEEFLPKLNRIRAQISKVKFYIVLGNTKTDKERGIYNYQELLETQVITKPALNWPEQNDDDIGYNIYTGGTTGMPKAISYNEKAMLKSTVEAFASSVPNFLQALSKSAAEDLLSLPGGKLLNSRIGRRLLAAKLTSRFVRWCLEHAPLSYNPAIVKKLSNSVRVLVASPMMHSLGWAIGFSLPKNGATLYLLEGKSYDPAEALQLIQNNQINFLAAIGDATLKPMLAELRKSHYQLDSLQAIFASGMPTSAEVKEHLLKKYMTNVRFIDFIGGSELTGMALKIYTSRDTEFNKASFPVTDRIMILNSETGQPVAPGEVGELARRTENLPNGYYNDPNKTQKLIRKINHQHWLMSGDLAKLDHQGFFHFVGRGSECINTGGEKVFPEEVENLLRQMPEIKEVGITATPSEKWGELVTAIVELEQGAQLTEQQVIDFTIDKISGYKRPRRIIFTDKFPVTLIGKPHYHALRQLAKNSLTSVA